MSNLYRLIQSIQENSSITKEDSMQRRLLSSKLKSLNDHLSALLQKKIRIDLEIKRTKSKLSKIKNQSKTYVKTRIELEGFDYDQLRPSDGEPLMEKLGQEIFEEVSRLDDLVDQAEELLKEIDQLPLYDD